MRVVLDSNVIIAAFITQGICHLILELCLSDHHIFLSEDILEEIGKNLRKKAKMQPLLVDAALSFLKKRAEVKSIEITEAHPRLDRQDAKVAALAAAVKADALITGDKDLLSLKEFKSVPIISPRDFWNLLRTQNKDLL